MVGLPGTIAVTLWEQIERALMGQLPIYSAARMSARIRGTQGHASSLDWTLGLLARGLYGSMLGLLFARLRAQEQRRWIAFTAGVVGFEMLVMPYLKLTTPLRRWRQLERLLLPAHVAAFSITARAVLMHVASGKCPAKAFSSNASARIHDGQGATLLSQNSQP